MAYNNYGKQKYKELDKNTSSFRLKNINAAFATSLQLGFWNGTFTLMVNPALPEGQRSSEKVWDYNTFTRGVLPAEKAVLLLDAIDEYMDEIKSGEDFDPFGVNAGASYFEISKYPAMDGVEDEGLFLNLYSKIDEQGNPGVTISHKFNSVEYYTNFKVSGKSLEKKRSKLPTEFRLFMIYLKEGIKGLSGGIAHGIRNANKYEYAREVNDRHRMMEKLGLSANDYKAAMNNGNGGNNNNNYFGGGDNSSEQNSNAGGAGDDFSYSVEYGQIGDNNRIDLS